MFVVGCNGSDPFGASVTPSSGFDSGTGITENAPATTAPTDTQSDGACLGADNGPADIGMNDTLRVTNSVDEWALNCSVGLDGAATCCGTLLNEVDLVEAIWTNSWHGVVFKNCIHLVPDSKNSKAPHINGTGMSVSGTRMTIIGSNPVVWSELGTRMNIVSCN
jgi:hypothetical protein